MTFKDYIEDRGFKYHEPTDSYRKSKGFGRFITVEKICSTLFTVKDENTVIFDNFIDSFEQFKQIINKTLEEYGN
jgi:hypothetical protein